MMTQKELLYLDDALNHEKNTLAYLDYIYDNCNECSEEFIANEIQIHKSILNNILDEMEKRSNE